MSPILNMPFLMLELFPSQRMIYENYRSTRIEEPPHRQHKHVSFVYTPSVFRIPHSAFRISFAICYLLFVIRQSVMLNDIRIIIHTAKGDLEATLIPADAPIATANFLNLAQRKFYDGLI